MNNTTPGTLAVLRRFIKQDKYQSCVPITDRSWVVRPRYLITYKGERIELLQQDAIWVGDHPHTLHYFRETIQDDFKVYALTPVPIPT